MTDTTESTAYCKNCNIELPVSRSGPCPECGGESKLIKVNMIAKIRFSANLSWEKRREYWERKPKLLLIMIVLSVLAPFVGMFVFGFPGVLIGLFISVLLYVISPRAIVKVKEITKGDSKH